MFRRITRRPARPRVPARTPLRLQRLEDRTVPSTFNWKVDANGNWNDASNWTLLSGTAGAGFPNAVGDSAVFNNVITASRTVTIPDGVTVTAGNLQINDDNNFTIAAAGTGKLVLDNTGTSPAGLLVANSAGNGAHTISAPLTLADPLTVTNQSTGALTLSGAIGESAAGRGLTTSAVGTVRLSGAAANTFTGVTEVDAGTLDLNKAPGAGAFGGNLIVGDGNGASASAVVRELQGGVIPAAAAVTVNADGLYNLLGQSESFGPLVINSGTVDAGAGLVSFAALTMTGGAITAAATGEVQFRGDATINASATGSSISGGHVQLLAATRTFTVADGPAVNDLELASEVRQTTGAVGLTKAGAGTLLLGGSTSNTYTGPTTVTGGTLALNKLGTSVAVAVPGALVINGGTVRHVVNDEITDAAAVTVNAGGALDLNGQPDTVGPVTVTGGTVRTSGTIAGRLTAGTTSLSPASTLAMKLVGSGNSDRLTVNGTLAVGGALQLSLAQTVAPGTAITLIDNDGTDAVAGTFANLPQGAMLSVGGQSFTISYTGGTGNDVVLTRAAAPHVLNVQSNGGAAQRSMVTSLAMTFDSLVTLPANAATAFTLTRIGGGAVTIGTATAQAVSGATVVTLTGFSGAEASAGGSLNDGRYTLTALAAQITANGQQLDGNGDGVTGDNFTFADSGLATGSQLFRLYGDVNGDRFVNGADFALFRTAFGSGQGDPNYSAALDANGDGFINGADFTRFRTNFGQGI